MRWFQVTLGWCNFTRVTPILDNWFQLNLTVKNRLVTMSSCALFPKLSLILKLLTFSFLITLCYTTYKVGFYFFDNHKHELHIISLKSPFPGHGRADRLLNSLHYPCHKLGRVGHKPSWVQHKWTLWPEIFEAMTHNISSMVEVAMALEAVVALKATAGKRAVL